MITLRKTVIIWRIISGILVLAMCIDFHERSERSMRRETRRRSASFSGTILRGNFKKINSRGPRG